MLKVFVVEDEPFLLNTIKRMIVNSHSGFEIIGDALNGRDALPLIEEKHPDVLFTDIRMPFMDGLTLIEELKKRRINPVTVILSGYGEFEYAKKAIHLQAYDYLLKPVSYEALEELLADLYEKYNAWEEKRQASILQDFIHNPAPDAAVYTDLSRYFQQKMYSYFLFCAGSCSIFPTNWITASKNFWLTCGFENKLQKLLPSSVQYWILDGAVASEKYLVISSENLHQAQISLIASRLHKELVSKGDVLTTIYGHCIQNITDLKHLLPLSRLYLRQHIIYSQSQVLSCTGQPGPEPGEHYFPLPRYEDSLSLYARNNYFEKFIHEVKTILEICRENSSTQLNLERILKNIIHIVSVSSFRELQAAVQKKYLELDELISSTSDYDELYEGIRLLFEEFFMTQSTKGPDSNSVSSVIRKVEDYMKSNYTKPIFLQELAEQFSLSSSQLSNAFKKQTGMPPSTYLTHLRIDKAKELLLIEPPVTLKEISDTVGYDDPFYFSRVFKLSVGTSPSEYRKGNHASAPRRT